MMMGSFAVDSRHAGELFQFGTLFCSVGMIWGSSLLAQISAGADSASREAMITQWRNIGPGGGGAFYDATWHPSNPEIVLAGSDVGGPLKSENAGDSWRSITRMVPDQGWREQEGIYAVERLVYAANAPNTVYLVGFGGVYRSLDGGEHWQKVIDPPSDVEEPTRYGAVAIDPEDANLVLVASGGRYFYNPRFGGGEDAYEAPEGFYWRSTNGGEEFERLVDSGLPAEFAATDLWMDPTSPRENRVVLMASLDGLFRSTDGGRHFERSDRGLPKSFVRDLGGGESIYLTLQADGTRGDDFTGGIYKSVDQGQTWSEVTGNLPVYDEEIDDILFDWSVAVDPTDSNNVYVLLGNNDSLLSGVYRSRDGGGTWQHLTPDWNASGFTTGYTDLQPGHGGTFLSISPADPNRLLYGNFFELIRSSDGGTTWQEAYSAQAADGSRRDWMSRGAEDTFVYDIVFDPFELETMWIGFEDIFHWKSEDRGKTLRRVANPNDEEFWKATDAAWQIVHDPNVRGHIYVSMSSPSAGQSVDLGGIYFSNDGGETWRDISQGLPEFRPEIAIEPSGNKGEAPIIYAAIATQGMYRSHDHGTTWIESNEGLGDEAVNVWRLGLDDTRTGALFLGMNTDDESNPGDGGLFRSTDGAETWKRIESFPVKEVIDLDVVEGVIYVSAVSEFSDEAVGGVYISRDGGVRWERVLDQPFVYAIAFDPGTPNTVYAAASVSTNQSHPDGLNPGIYWSADGGANWDRLDAYMPHYQLRALAVDPLDSKQIYVGTLGQGVLHGTIEDGGRLESPAGRGALALVFRGFDSDGGARIGVVGSDGARVTVEVSEDLEEWTVLDRLVLDNGETEYVDETATEIEFGFYRAVLSVE